MSHRPALFLDRDGVINIDHNYVYKQEDFEFVDGIFRLCRTAKQLGCLIFVVTNQAGIGRGYYTKHDFLELTDWMCSIFKSQGAGIDEVYYCPCHPEHGVGTYKIDSPDRKPSPGMILRAVDEFCVDLSRSVLVGDKESDIQAGIAAGVAVNLLYCHLGSDRPMHSAATAVVDNLESITNFFGHVVGNRVCS